MDFWNDKINIMYNKLPLFLEINDKKYILSDNAYKRDVINDEELYIWYSTYDILNDDEFLIKFETWNFCNDTTNLYNYLCDNKIITP